MSRRNSKKNSRKKKALPKRRSFTRLIFSTLFGLVAKMTKGGVHLLIWLVVMTLRAGKKNPLAAFGLCCFMALLAFVGANALFHTHRLSATSTALTPDLRMIEIQDGLAEMGFYDGEIDGLGGIKTQAAVENWQKLRHVLEKGKADFASHQIQEDALARIIRQTQE